MDTRSHLYVHFEGYSTYTEQAPVLCLYRPCQGREQSPPAWFTSSTSSSSPATMMATAHCSGCSSAGEEALHAEEASSAHVASNSGCGKPPWSSSESKAKLFQEWNRAFLLVCAGGLFVDPLFFYALSISRTCMCVFIDGWFAVTVTVLRCTNDAVHLLNLWLQVRTAAYDAGRRASADEEGCKAIAKVRRLSFLKSVLFDLFVILPVPQVTSSCCLLLHCFIS